MASDDRPQLRALLASGRTADVHTLGTARVVRCYRENIDAAAEAVVMEHVRAHGFPAPMVYRAEGHEIEMARLEGPTMLRALIDGHLSADNAARVLAGLQHDLHAIPPVAGADPMMSPDELDRLRDAAALVETSRLLKTD